MSSDKSHVPYALAFPSTLGFLSPDWLVLPWRVNPSPQDICGTVKDEGMDDPHPRPGGTVLSMYTVV